MPETPLTILLVDESTFFLTMENQFLRKLPVTIREAYRADQAVALCREEPPDLIFMAYGLPDRTGAECCRTIKADPDLGRIPVILICNEAAEDQLEESQNAGCDAVVTRPLNRKRFLELAHHFLAGVGEMRRLCRIPVRVLTPEKTFRATGFDISTGGMFIACSEMVAPGTSVRLELQLTPADTEETWITCSGSVGWINSVDQGPKPYYPLGFGVRFTEMAETDLAALNQYLLSRKE